MAKQLKLFESVSSASKSSKSTSKPKNPQKPRELKSARIKNLQERIEYHQHLYYNSQPEIYQRVLNIQKFLSKEFYSGDFF